MKKRTKKIILIIMSFLIGLISLFFYFNLKDKKQVSYYTNENIQKENTIRFEMKYRIILKNEKLIPNDIEFKKSDMLSKIIENKKLSTRFKFFNYNDQMIYNKTVIYLMPKEGLPVVKTYFKDVDSNFLTSRGLTQHLADKTVEIFQSSSNFIEAQKNLSRSFAQGKNKEFYEEAFPLLFK